MGRRKFWLLAVMIFSTLICGCATFMQYGKLEGNARRNYQRGNYDLAVSEADVGKVLGVHEIVTGKINQIIYVPSSTTSADTSREKSVASGTEKYTDSNGKTQERTVYKTVYATLHVNTRTSSASLTGSYSIIDVKTAKLKKTDSFSETDKFECQWATYSGDERALDSDDKKYGPEMPAPIEEEMVNRAAKKLSVSLARTLKDYAR